MKIMIYYILLGFGLWFDRLAFIEQFWWVFHRPSRKIRCGWCLPQTAIVFLLLQPGRMKECSCLTTLPVVYPDTAGWVCSWRIEVRPESIPLVFASSFTVVICGGLPTKKSFRGIGWGFRWFEAKLCGAIDWIAEGNSYLLLFGLVGKKVQGNLISLDSGRSLWRVVGRVVIVGHFSCLVSCFHRLTKCFPV